MSGERKEKVAVVGAGISGISAALYLRNAGFDVTVYEQRSRPAEAGTGVASGLVQPWLSPYTNLGLLSTLKSKLCPYKFIAKDYKADTLAWSDLLVPFLGEAFKFSLPNYYAKVRVHFFFIIFLCVHFFVFIGASVSCVSFSPSPPSVSLFLFLILILILILLLPHLLCLLLPSILITCALMYDRTSKACARCRQQTTLCCWKPCAR